MYALIIKLNEETLATIGASNAIFFNSHIHISIDELGAALDLRGMLDLGSERTSHVNWLNPLQLQSGDLLCFHFVDSDVVTPPIEERATDSEEYISDQAAFEEEVRLNSPSIRNLKQVQPNANIQLTVLKNEPIIATLESGREFIAFHIVWDQFNPERCYVSLSSFSQKEADSRSGGKDWFRGKLLVGEQCTIKLGT